MKVKPGYKQTEVGPIPEEWEVKPLGRFVALQRGYDLTEGERRTGEVPVMGSAGPNGFHDTVLVRGPGVVLGRSGASFGQAHYCASDFWPHNTALYVTDFFGNHPLFSFYLLKSINFSRYNSGGAQQSLNRNFIAPILVAVPKRDMQEWIAEALSDADALIESLERLIVKKRQLKRGAMQELLTGKKRLPGFNGAWDAPLLGDLFTFKNGLNKAKKFFGYGTPIVNYMDVYQKRGIFASDLQGRVSLSKDELRAFGVRKGDVFFTRTSETSEEVGIASVMLDDPCDTVFSGFVLRARPNDDSLDNQFEKYCFSTAAVRKQITSQSTETTRALTNGRFMSLVAINRPPKLEQIAIAAILGDMDAEVAALDAKLAKVRQLKQGMMHELLTGRIRLV